MMPQPHLTVHPPSSDEDDMIRNILKGQKELFTVLFQRYSSGCRYYFWTKCGRNWETAGDLCQEAFLRAFRSLSTFQPGTSFRKWLRTICHHLSIDHYKSAARRETLVPRDPPPVPDPAQEAINRQTIQQALDVLPERQRDVIALKYFWNCTLEEICSILDLPLGTAKLDLSQGRKRLMELLDQGKSS